MKTVLYVVLLFLSSNAFGAYGDVEIGKCFPAHVFQMQVIKRYDDRHYALIGLNLAPQHPKANILETVDTTMSSTGRFGFQIKLEKIETKEMPNGFPGKVAYWKECKNGK